ncbi:uncharacterized protein LOC117567815 [Drosophila albomicans]|uniref:Uncharacterized protein LOC117567815 n=1 Tax=Drosophila albomicans TaxID=7291 RepID=A0A9C6TB24_DROAB|nr:uncharacterized protein LOC117567815 [Drosophila albomicans]
MRDYLGFILLICVAAAVEVADKIPTPTTPTTTMPKTTTTTTVKPEQRPKRQLIPVYYDNFNANPPVEPVQPLLPVAPLPSLQPVQPLQPIAVVAPVQQQPGFLPAFAQNLPLVGPILTSLPLQSLSNMLGGLGTTVGGLNLGNLGQLGALGNLGNLGSLGQIGNLANLGGQKPGGAAGATGSQSCPLTQKLSCRCEPLLSLPSLPQVREPETHLIKIVKQNVRRNADGSSELRLVLSNAVVLYHRNEKDAIKQQGYFALPFRKELYLNVHYSINQSNYTVKADISDSPPKSDFESWMPVEPELV